MTGRRILGCRSEGLFLVRGPDAAPADLIGQLRPLFVGMVFEVSRVGNE
jgi:hypothetical protein